METVKTMDDAILELMEKLKEKKAEFEKVQSNATKSWVTNCSYSFKPDGTDKKNLAVMNEQEVVALLADVLMRIRFLTESTFALGLKIDTHPKFQGYTYEQWLTDCQKRIAVIGFNSKKKEIEEMEAALNSLVSPELQRKIALEELTKKISSM